MSEKQILFSSLLLAGLVLLGTEVFIRRHHTLFSREFTQTREAIIATKQQAVLERTRSADVLFLGDSTVNAAIDDARFEQLTGRSCMNLGLNGSMVTYSDYTMLKAYLKRFPPPKAIVIWHTLDVWQRDLDLAVFGFSLPDWPDRRAALQNTLHGLRWTPTVIYWPIKSAAQIIEGSLYLLSDAYRFQVWIKKHLAADVPGLDPAGLVERMEVSEQPIQSRIADQIRAVSNLPNEISPDNRYWLQKVIALATERHITIYTARSPVQERLKNDPGAAVFLRKQNALLDELFQSYPMIHQLNRDNPTFREDESHGDKDHVNEKGKEMLTRYYAGLLRP